VKQEIIDTFLSLRTLSPLVQNITNFVVMNNTANALLSVGASPIMSHAQEEAEDMMKIVNSLLVNIGTLDSEWIACMKHAVAHAKAQNKPYVLDPVGAGASSFRTTTAINLIEQHRPHVIRGNGSEIMALNRTAMLSKGVDSSVDAKNAVTSASQLAEKYATTVVISGASDFIVSVNQNSNRISRVDNGHSIMTKITGMGCTASALVAACLGVNNNPHSASLCAMTIMGVCGELANKRASGPGSFQMYFLDALYELTESQLAASMKVTDV